MADVSVLFAHLVQAVVLFVAMGRTLGTYDA